MQSWYINEDTKPYVIRIKLVSRTVYRISLSPMCLDDENISPTLFSTEEYFIYFKMEKGLHIIIIKINSVYYYLAID